MGDNSSAAADVPAEFARRRKRQILVTIPAFIIGFVAFTIATREESQPAGYLPMGIAAVALVSLVVFSLVNWRCPACNGYLRKATNPKFCPNCGVALRSSAGT